jgi:hypothetical protein
MLSVANKSVMPSGIMGNVVILIVVAPLNGAQFGRHNIWAKANRPSAKKPKVLNFLSLLFETASINLSVVGSTYSG